MAIFVLQNKFLCDIIQNLTQQIYSSAVHLLMDYR